MAKYRQLYTEFWSDSFVLELTPEEKYFYLYLMTNTKTTQCGIYEISKRIIEAETGYNRETVEKLIKRFCEYNKILYCEDTKELMVINWIKYNVPNNRNSITCIQREIQKVKNNEFIKVLFNKCQERGLDVEKIFETSSERIFNKLENIEQKSTNDDIKTENIQEISKCEINKPLTRDLPWAYKWLASNRIRSNKEELINNKQKEINKEEEEEVISSKNNSAADSDGLKNIIKIYEENIHDITPFEYEKLLDFKKHVTSEVIIMAIEEAINYNAKTLKYISKIINSWISHGIKTAEEVKVYQKKWAIKKSSGVSRNVKVGGFCDYQQRTYDYDDLEKKLLGHMEDEDSK